MSTSLSTLPLLQRLLPILGAIPFVAAATLLSMGTTEMPWGGTVVTMVRTYGVVIASFMAGVHWGQHLSLDKPTRSILAILSNAAALLVWAVFLSAGEQAIIITLALVFIALLVIDLWLSGKGVISIPYLQIRALVTAVVVASLAIVGFQI